MADFASGIPACAAPTAVVIDKIEEPTPD